MKIWILCLVVLAGCNELDAPPPFAPAGESLGAASVVRISVPLGAGYCSAVVVSPTQLATARHCAESGVDAVPGARVLSVDLHELHDLAIIHVDAAPAPVIGIARYEPEHEEAVSVVGYCRDRFGVREHAYLFALNGYIDTVGEACGGDSGGAVIDDDGDLLGIIVGGQGGGRLLSVDVAVLVEMLEK